MVAYCLQSQLIEVNHAINRLLLNELLGEFPWVGLHHCSPLAMTTMGRSNSPARHSVHACSMLDLLSSSNCRLMPMPSPFFSSLCFTIVHVRTGWFCGDVVRLLQENPTRANLRHPSCWWDAPDPYRTGPRQGAVELFDPDVVVIAMAHHFVIYEFKLPIIGNRGIHKADR